MANYEIGKVHSNPFARAFKPQPIVEVDGEDHEVKMAEGQLEYIIKTANELKQKLGGMEKNIPGWIQDHISKSHSYLHQANSGYHELGETKKSMKLTSLLSLNEDANMNKKVKALLDNELRGLPQGKSEHQFAVMHTLIGALRDANFHSELKKVPPIFPKAEYLGDSAKEEDTIDLYEYEIGPKVANICGYDGGEIVDAIGFYVSMTIGRPVGEKIQKLVEIVTENKMNAYISSNDGKTFTIYNSNKEKVKNVSKQELEKLMRVGNNYSSNMNWNEFMSKFDKTTNLGNYWKYWKGNLINVTIPNIGENKSVNENTKLVKLLGIEFNVSEMNGRIFFSFVDKKAATIQLRQVGTNKIVNHIQTRLDIAYGKGTFFFKSGDHAEFQNGYLFQRNTADINLNKLKSEVVKENTEPPTITQLRDIIKNKQYKMVKDPKTGKSLGIDMQTANAVLQIYDGLSNINKENMIKMGLPKMMDVSFKILNKYKK